MPLYIALNFFESLGIEWSLHGRYRRDSVSQSSWNGLKKKKDKMWLTSSFIQDLISLIFAIRIKISFLIP